MRVNKALHHSYNLIIVPSTETLFAMDRRESKGSVTLQKKMVEQNRRKTQNNNAPDLTDFMNDVFFGTVASKDKKEYNLTGGRLIEDEDVDFDDSTRSNSSTLTQEWLEEAKLMVASSPTRCDSPSRLAGSPRFATAQARLSASILDRRDPLSRSARRQRSLEGFSGEILSKSIKHTQNKSASQDTLTPASPDQSPADAVHKWLSNFLKPSVSSSTPSSPISPTKNTPSSDPAAPIVPPRQSTHRRSRFQTENPEPQSQGIPVNSRRTFRTTPTVVPDPTRQLLSSPKNLIVDTAHKRTFSSSSCSSPTPLDQPLSPPKNLVESAQKRSITKSTCSIEKVAPKSSNIANGRYPEENGSRDIGLNEFLKEQRITIEKISCGAVDSKAKIVLPAASNSTSSMVAAICYAWLLENRRKNKEQGNGYVAVPVMNMKREKMWRHLQAAWLFHHVGLDATYLLFADEVDLEILMMTGQLSILCVGQDVLRNNDEVGSQCTMVTDNYCEDAYDLLQSQMLKKTLLAGILLDTQNLDSSSSLSISRDAEAVQLLLVGSSPNYRNNLFDQLMQDKTDRSFLEAMRHNYGKPPDEDGQKTGAKLDRVPQRKSNSTSHQKAVTQNSNIDSKDAENRKTNNMSTNSAKPNSVPAQASAAPPGQASPNPNRGKNKFFLAKWFGFGSK